MAVYQIHSNGIYHGLPVYSPEVSGLSAIITGANGISGQYMLKVLSLAPNRWKKIYCLSRRPPLVPDGLPPNAEHIPLDFLEDPEVVFATLKQYNVHADHCFFFAYLQPSSKPGDGLWSNHEEMVRVNALLLQNFLDALKLASIIPKRFMLQTGAKNYGGHLGPTKVPQEESDPRIELVPNFYYAQEDALYKFCAETGCAWNIVMPGPILGAVPDAAMNAAFPLAVYASVCKKMGTPFEYPADVNSFAMTTDMSSAMMNAYMEEWSVLLGPPNEKFNAADGSAFAWEKAWPRIAESYGIEWSGPKDDDDEYTEQESPFCPRGYGPKSLSRRRFRLSDWAKREDVKHAWHELAVEHGLKTDNLDGMHELLAFTDGVLCRTAPLHFSMDKSRKLGWFGYVDSKESYLDVFKGLADLKMVPPVPNA